MIAKAKSERSVNGNHPFGFSAPFVSLYPRRFKNNARPCCLQPSEALLVLPQVVTFLHHDLTHPPQHCTAKLNELTSMQKAPKSGAKTCVCLVKTFQMAGLPCAFLENHLPRRHAKFGKRTHITSASVNVRSALEAPAFLMLTLPWGSCDCRTWRHMRLWNLDSSCCSAATILASGLRGRV